MNNPKISIIILNWNGLNDTLECLDSIRKIDYRNFEVIIVDNASRNDEASAIKGRFPFVTLIKNLENLGFAEGNNIGVKKAVDNGADYILLLNNDTIVDSELLKELLSAAADHAGYSIFSPKIFYHSFPDKIWFAGGKWDEGSLSFFHEGLKEKDDMGKFGKFKEIDYACGCAIFFKSEVVREIGFLDKNFFLLFEETDWCYRARKSGFKSLFVPEAKVWHKVSLAFGGSDSPLRSYFFARNYLLWMHKHLSFFKRLFFFKIIFNIFFPNASDKKLKAFFVKRLYWDFLEAVKNRGNFFAKVIGVYDYFIGRFGNCPSTVIELNRKHKIVYQ